MNTSNDSNQNVKPQETEAGRVADLIALIWRRRLLVGGTIGIILAVTVIAVFVMTPQYTAQATFMAPPDEAGAISSFLRDPLNAVLRRGGGASLDRLMSFLNSLTTRRLLVERYNLQEHYKVRLFTEALVALEHATAVVISTEGAISVSVTDRNPRLAAELANGYVSIVDSLYRDAETRHAGELRRFLEKRVDENRAALVAAETSARDFAQRYGVISLPDQVSALVDQMASVEAQIQALDVRIGATRQILGPDHFSLREMAIQRGQLVAQRQSLRESRGTHASDPLLSFREVPDRALEYARLEREIKIQALIQQLLVQQYEMAKLDEMRNISSLTRVDRALPPEIRSWPRRGRIIVLSGAMGVLWGILLAYLAEAWPGMRRRIAASSTARARREAQKPGRGEG